MVSVSALAKSSKYGETETVCGLEVPENIWLEEAKDAGLACIMLAGIKASGPIYVMATYDPITRLKELQDAHWRGVYLFDSFWFPDRAMAMMVEKDAWRLFEKGKVRARPKGRWVNSAIGWVGGTIVVAARNVRVPLARQEDVRKALTKGWIDRHYFFRWSNNS